MGSILRSVLSLLLGTGKRPRAAVYLYEMHHGKRRAWSWELHVDDKIAAEGLAFGFRGALWQIDGALKEWDLNRQDVAWSWQRPGVQRG